MELVIPQPACLPAVSLKASRDSDKKKKKKNKEGEGKQLDCQ